MARLEHTLVVGMIIGTEGTEDGAVVGSDVGGFVGSALGY
jgi:hypothetical protein